MTPADSQFREWLYKQPPDRVFTVSICNCPLAAFGREVLGMRQPCPDFHRVRDAGTTWHSGVVIPSAHKPVERMMVRSQWTSLTPEEFFSLRITAQQFRQLYEESNANAND